MAESGNLDESPRSHRPRKHGANFFVEAFAVSAIIATLCVLILPAVRAAKYAKYQPTDGIDALVDLLSSTPLGMAAFVLVIATTTTAVAACLRAAFVFVIRR